MHLFFAYFSEYVLLFLDDNKMKKVSGSPIVKVQPQGAA